MILRKYQEELIKYLHQSDKEIECIGLPTGSGKTFVFSFFACQMAAEFNIKTVIAVHREEILNQTKKQIQDTLGFSCGLVTAKNQLNRLFPIQIVMVETISRRKKDLEYLKENYDLLIIDECHIGNFSKIIKGFSRVVGFSATPISAKKTIPLKATYHHLHYPIQINDLINENHLCKPETWVHPKAITSKELVMDATGTDYDLNQMGDLLSAEKYTTTLLNYVDKFCNNKKTIIYNANIKHSLAVTSVLKASGYNVYHIDGETSRLDRETILGKLFTEQEIIICNVGVLTTGFDCPEVEVIILNRRTKSLSLYIQMAGRGSRIASAINKDKFTILDMCNNYEEHNGAWQDDVDWQLMFSKIKKKREGVAPTKRCKVCGYINHAKASQCVECNAEFISNSKSQKEKDPHLVLLESENSKGNTEFKNMILKFKDKGYSVFYSLRIHIKETIEANMDLSCDTIIKIIMQDLPEWCKINGIKRIAEFHRNYVNKTTTEIYASKHLQKH